MTHTVETDQPAQPLPNPTRCLTWASGPALATAALAAWLILRPPPAPYRIATATTCVVTAGATGVLLLAALVLLVARRFADRYDNADDRAAAHQRATAARLARMEDRQIELVSYLVAHGVQIAKLDDRAQQICRNTKRIGQGLDELRTAYIEGPRL